MHLFQISKRTITKKIPHKRSSGKVKINNKTIGSSKNEKTNLVMQSRKKSIGLASLVMQSRKKPKQDVSAVSSGNSFTTTNYLVTSSEIVLIPVDKKSKFSADMNDVEFNPLQKLKMEDIINEQVALASSREPVIESDEFKNCRFSLISSIRNSGLSLYAESDDSLCGVLNINENGDVVSQISLENLLDTDSSGRDKSTSGVSNRRGKSKNEFTLVQFENKSEDMNDNLLVIRNKNGGSSSSLMCSNDETDGMAVIRTQLSSMLESDLMDDGSDTDTYVMARHEVVRDNINSQRCTVDDIADFTRVTSNNEVNNSDGVNDMSGPESGVPNMISCTVTNLLCDNDDRIVANSIITDHDDLVTDPSSMVVNPNEMVADHGSRSDRLLINPDVTVLPNKSSPKDCRDISTRNSINPKNIIGSFNISEGIPTSDEKDVPSKNIALDISKNNHSKTNTPSYKIEIFDKNLSENNNLFHDIQHDSDIAIELVDKDVDMFEIMNAGTQNDSQIPPTSTRSDDLNCDEMKKYISSPSMSLGNCAQITDPEDDVFVFFLEGK